MKSWRVLLPTLICLLQLTCGKPAPTPAPQGPPARAFHLHLPGIGGKLFMDRYMVEGLELSKMDADIQVYDWTRNDAGINALLAYQRNREEAQQVAKIILEKYREDPRRKITITSHSGGGGLAVWALEGLPPDVMIDSMIFLAPALSPQYDLSPALRHVRGKVYSFNSELDVAVLGLGTKLFGTIDGVRTEAAGKIGFTRPPTGDEQQYAKLVQIPYERVWMQYGNVGDHVGAMRRLFAQEVIAPLIINGRRPPRTPATTQADAQ